MKNALAIALLCLLSLSLVAGQKAPKTSNVEDQVKELEQDWIVGTGGEGGIRTLGTGVSPYNGLAI